MSNPILGPFAFWGLGPRAHVGFRGDCYHPGRGSYEEKPYPERPQARHALPGDEREPSQDDAHVRSRRQGVHLDHRPRPLAVRRQALRFGTAALAAALILGPAVPSRAANPSLSED